jgi:hypothetical protein
VDGRENAFSWGRLVLINSVLSNLSMFMLSFFEVPRGVLKRLDYYRSRLFWHSDGHKKKYRLTKWSVLFTPKDQGADATTCWLLRPASSGSWSSRNS